MFPVSVVELIKCIIILTFKKQSGPKKKVVNINTVDNLPAPMDNGSNEPDISFWAEQTQDFGDTQDFPDDIDYGDDDIPTDAFENADTSKIYYFRFPF